MRNVYFASFCLDMAEGAKKEFLYLPYSTGTIWAYANTDDRIKQSFTLKEMYIKKMPIDELVAELDDPAMFGFSSYVWNHQYNLEVARQVKKKFPDCQIVFGGPSVSINDKNFMKENTYIDYAVYLEGEISFRDVLLDILGYDVEFFGVATQKNKPSGKPRRIQDLDIIPSPYTAGYFDHVIERHKGPNVLFNATIETNRGCPFQCTFCDWGQTTAGKVKKFQMCRVHEDLLWCAQNDIDLVSNADANYGAFKERDMEVAKYFVKLNKQYGAPRQFNSSWHKNQTPEVVSIAEEFVKHGLIRKYGVSFQSMDDKVLKAIKRKNITLEQYDKILEMARKYKVAVSSDVMLPLPGQTVQSHLDELDFMMEKDVFPIHCPTTVLPGAEMHDPDYRKQWGLETQIVDMPTTTKYVPEKEEYLIGTKHMSTAEYHDLMLTSWTMQAFLVVGFTDIVSKYFYKKYKVKYTEFHDLLWRYFAKGNHHTSKWIKPLIGHIEKKTTAKLSGGVEAIPMHDDLGGINRDLFFWDLKNFCKDKLPETQDLDDLLALQYNNQNYTGTAGDVKVSCQSNLLEYIDGIEQVYQPVTYIFKYSDYADKTASIGVVLSNGRYSRTWKNKVSRHIPVNVV